VHILVATDADWVLEELRAALEEPGTTFTLCRSGREVARAVAARKPDVALLDLQMGSMGGIAVAMQQRLDESVGAAPRVPLVLLLDRAADLHLAKRSGADGWLIKPLDALRIRRAVRAVTSGGTVQEGVPVLPAEPAEESHESAEGEAVTTG
jgi:CheY-like chemotaxis protein